MPAATPSCATSATAGGQRSSRSPPPRKGPPGRAGPPATTEKWTDREGRPAEATEWHRIVVYGPAVGAVETMLRKGDRVMVEGRIATRSFRDKDGKDRTATEIVVSRRQDTVNMLSGRRAESAVSPDADDGAGQA